MSCDNKAASCCKLTDEQFIEETLQMLEEAMRLTEYADSTG